ncbi:TonB-dependent receptor plug domain-containing protein [Qipengyuania gelatinilytica]|uniref:TonB-dependent receptor n=1 Tax=Qipengyuania gelatinilytica TaxID=2867231 RepID=A0ABX9A300_9SPHN|nr:TonB-dependent receptor [Qipengyuania gelatinilytica]QZD95661.1 TonB-dependent receptor [Qipengyuania gelatinilytica]
MRKNSLRRAALFASCSIFICHPAVAQDRPDATDDETILTDTILVTAFRRDDIATDTSELPDQIAIPADAASIAARAPGGALVGNGVLSGQLSYRGLAGKRVLGRINGQRFASGGPNAMDPPLHYAPSLLVDRVEIARGVAPVSSGPALAGSVDAKLVEAHFTDGPALDVQARMTSQYRSNDDSFAVAGLAGVANDRWRLGVIASREEGESYEFPGGTAVGTSFERNLYGVHGGFKAGPGKLFLEYRRSETDPTGNPPFALDIVYFDTDFVRGGFRGEIAEDIGIDIQLGHVSVRHLMDNQTTRLPAAEPMRARATFADADTNTVEVSLQFGSSAAHLEIGGDVELTDKFVRITNPFNDAFFIDAQPNVSNERIGAYAQWRGGIEALAFEVGARIDRTRQSAGNPTLGTAVPMGPRIIAADFIASDRERDETTVDAVARLWIDLGDLTPRLSLARKERVPSLLERFGWLPTEASYGLADGSIYVGNLDLAPETAWIAEIGFDWSSEFIALRPTIFYRRVDDYIQGVPFDSTVGVIDSPVEMIAAMNGDATPLRFGNVDAELYGADLDFLFRPVRQFEVSGTASYVRGERRDIEDNLYRVAPANFRLSGTWSNNRLALGAELVAAAGQTKISISNDEERSEGYAIVGLFGRYSLTNTISVEAGVENLFDESYQPHLAGRNRVAASDIAVGDRLYGPGRGAWIRVSASF